MNKGVKDMNQDIISRQEAIDLLRKRLIETANNNVGIKCDAGQVFEDVSERIKSWLNELQSVQPEPAIPLSWIEGQIEWLKSLDNAFLTLTAGQISAMMNNWKDEQNEGFNQQTRCD